MRKKQPPEAFRRAAWQAQLRIASRAPFSLWGVPTDPGYAGARAVHDSEQLHNGLQRLEEAGIPSGLSSPLRDAVAAVGALLALRPGWLAHWEQQQGEGSVSRAGSGDRAMVRSIDEEFPKPSTVQSWPDSEAAEQAVIEALPVLDRLQQALALHTGRDLIHRSSGPRWHGGLEG